MIVTDVEKIVYELYDSDFIFGLCGSQLVRLEQTSSAADSKELETHETGRLQLFDLEMSMQQLLTVLEHQPEISRSVEGKQMDEFSWENRKALDNFIRSRGICMVRFLDGKDDA